MLLPPDQWDDAPAAAVASVEREELFAGSGKDRQLVGHTVKVKLWDKNSAAEKLMRHLGLFERDNKQHTDPLTALLTEIAKRGSRLPIHKA